MSRGDIVMSELEDVVNKFYEENDYIILREIVDSLKKKIVTAMRIADAKIKATYTFKKSKEVHIIVTFNDFFRKPLDIVIKFSEQKSKSVVPSQVKRSIKGVNKRVLELQGLLGIREIDVTVMYITPRYTHGVDLLPTDISFTSKVASFVGKFFVTTPKKLMDDFDSHFLKYLRDRTIGLVKKAKELMDNNRRFDKVENAINTMITVLKAFKNVLYGERMWLPYEVKEVTSSLIVEKDLEEVRNYLYTYL